ncbi:MAG: hypothetical protein P0S96_05365 [Simkaniaceae bacterium]|nr:hypothetical protein [Candidatus Sacchlamyda saccharinae]
MEGNLKQALQYAKKLENSRFYSSVIIKIAVDLATYSEELELAIQLAQSLPDRNRAEAALAFVACSLAERGHIHKAMSTMFLIPNLLVRIEGIADMIRNHPREQELLTMLTDYVMSLRKQLDQQQMSDAAFEVLSRANARAKKHDQAVECANLIASPVRQKFCLEMSLQELQKNQGIKKALDFAESLQGKTNIDWFYSELVERLVVEYSKMAIKKNPQPQQLDFTRLEDCVNISANTSPPLEITDKYLVQATEIAGKIKENEMRVDALLQVPLSLAAHAGEYQQAVAMVFSFSHQKDVNPLLHRIAVECLSNGYVRQAIEIAFQIDSLLARLDAFFDIRKQFKNLENKKTFLKMVFAYFLSILDEIQDQDVLESYCRRLSHLMASIHENDKAMELIDRIEIPFVKENAIMVVVSSYCEQEEIEKALELALLIKNPERRDECYADICKWVAQKTPTVEKEAKPQRINFSSLDGFAKQGAPLRN